MRATARSGERGLRVGLVREGRVLEERKLRSGQSLSIGSSERCDFVLGESSAPRFVRVFSWTRAGARLELVEGVSGRVVGAAGAFELESLVAQGRRHVELEPGARGKIVFGGAALLFQLVIEAPLPARPQLPLALKSRPIDVDWRTTIVGAMSFLLHFAVIGSFYSDWADPVVDDDIVVSDVIDAVRMPAPPIVENVAPDATPTANANPSPSPSTVAPNPAATPGRHSEGRNTANPPSTAEQAALGRELQALALETVGTLGREGPATRDVLRDSGDLPTGPLDEAARSGLGVAGPTNLSVASGRAMRPGTESGKLSDLGNTKRADSGDTGHLERPRGPTGNVNVAPPTKTGAVPNAERVIFGLRAAFRQCYQRGLDQFPDAEGSVRLTFSIGPNGEPSSVSATSSGNLPGSVVSCIQGRARSAQFDAPEGGSAVVIAPVILRKQ